MMSSETWRGVGLSMLSRLLVICRALRPDMLRGSTTMLGLENISRIGRSMLQMLGGLFGCLCRSIGMAEARSSDRERLQEAGSHSSNLPVPYTSPHPKCRHILWMHSHRSDLKISSSCFTMLFLQVEHFSKYPKVDLKSHVESSHSKTYVTCVLLQSRLAANPISLTVICMQRIAILKKFPDHLA